MPESLFELIPPDRRALARLAIGAVADSGRVTALGPVTGGASGALTYRVEAGARSYLLRMETGRFAFQNPDHYACMEAAAHAGIAPPLRFVDPKQGIAVMDFVTQHPLQEYPGGSPALMRDLGGLIRRLQDSAAFPAPAIPYFELIRRMLAFVRRSRVFAAGLLDPHQEGFERIGEAYPWNEAARVSSHNDPNPRNILFDGARLWLVDWEGACRNDALTDLAVVTHELAGTPDLQQQLLRSWLGREPDPTTNARLVLMRQLTAMFYACVIFRRFAGESNREPDWDLKALTGAEFTASIAQGRLRLGTPELLYEFGKMFLAGFRDGLTAPGFEEALVAARQG